jgi:hypothetical protein
MIIIMPEGPANVHATFRLRCGASRHEVCVVGDFNDWSPTANPMTFDGYCYVAEVGIPTGRAYRFRYLIDDERWMIDWGADRYTPNEFGGGDSILDLTTLRTSMLASTGCGHSTRRAVLASRRSCTEPTNSVWRG